MGKLDHRYKGPHWTIKRIAQFAGVSTGGVKNWITAYDNTFAPFPRPIVVTRGFTLWDKHKVKQWLKDGRKLIPRPESIGDMDEEDT